jgi:acyl-CoA thioesterase FadM
VTGVHRFESRVPHHEVGPLGELRPSALVRLLQEAAIEASAAAGFSERWYREAGSQWVVRRTWLGVGGALRGGDTAEVATWVADVRRVRSRRDYEIRSAGRLVARAWSDWVYVDLARGRPARVPDEMIAAFDPTHAGDELPREPLTVGAPPGDAFFYERPVVLRDVDGLGHVNNAVAVDVFEEALVAALERAGWPIERIAAEGRALALAEIDVEYLDPSRLGTTLDGRLWRLTGTGVALRSACLVQAASAVPATRALATWTWLDRASGEATAFPPELESVLPAHPPAGEARI